MREPSERLAGQGRQLYFAGAIALTEPGPAAAGVVVRDERGRLLAQRSQFVGHGTQQEAATQALVLALRLAVDGHIEAPAIRTDDRDMIRALRQPESLPDGAPLTEPIRELLGQLGEYQVESVSHADNPARLAALAPLVDWLPERARKAEDLRIRQVADFTYEVESQSQPGQVYRINVPDDEQPGQDVLRCQCADFEYRGIPCKHVIAVAREAGRLNRLFYPPVGSER